MNFFVIGLPRSRTAWLANFLTYNNHYCFHEGIDGCNNIYDYIEKLGDSNGDASTGLMLFDMNKQFPESPKVIIESDIKKAIDYSYKTYGYFDSKYVYDLQDRLNQIDGLRIKFDDIDDRLEEIWDYLIGTPFDKRRAEILKRLRIEIKDPFDFNMDSMDKLCHSVNSK